MRNALVIKIAFSASPFLIIYNWVSFSIQITCLDIRTLAYLFMYHFLYLMNTLIDFIQLLIFK